MDYRQELATMETILFLAHTEADGSLAKPALEAWARPRPWPPLRGSTLVVGLVGENGQAAADASPLRRRQIPGRQRALTSPSPATPPTPPPPKPSARPRRPRIVVAPATSRWNRVLAGVAQRLGGRVDTHVTGVSAANGAVSSQPLVLPAAHGSRACSAPQRPGSSSLTPAASPPGKAKPARPPSKPSPVPLPDACKRTTVVGVRAPAADAQTIRPEAELLFVAGAGWTKKQADGQPHVKEAEKLILGFLEAARASLGSSKSLVDLGGEGQAVLSFLTHLNQIGQTGSTPRHPKGLATCCHGEEPHTVGWRFINERRAINLDPNCGWARGKADVLYVADAFAVMAKVNSLLGS